MGLGRLNPGCDTCHTCVDCELILDGCSVVWDCPIDGMHIVGADQFTEFFRSTDNSGSYENPTEGSRFTIYRDIAGVRTQVVTLLVSGLPVECCSESQTINPGSWCRNIYTNLDGMTINVTGLPSWMSELEGLYILSYSESQNYVSAYRMRTPVVNFPDQGYPYWTCSNVRINQNPGGLQYDYVMFCPSNGFTPASDIFNWIGFYVEVNSSDYRCSQSINAGVRVNTMNFNRRPTGEGHNFCRKINKLAILSREAIGCNDPADILTVDFTDRFPELFAAESFYSSCSGGAWLEWCCPVSPF